jgi:phospholipid:diacylglycerol acyltransferase
MVESSRGSVGPNSSSVVEGADCRLPNAPSMKIYCLYGHGKETERSYWYMQGEYEQDESRSDGVDETAFVSRSVIE